MAFRFDNFSPAFGSDYLKLKKMIYVILNLLLTLINAMSAYRNYKEMNYRLAIFNSFASGFCLMGSIAIFINEFL